MKDRVSTLLVSLLLVHGAALASDEYKYAPAKDKSGDPLDDAEVELHALKRAAEEQGPVLVWVDMYHPFNIDCDADEVRAIRTHARLVLQSVRRSEVVLARTATNVAPECAPGFAAYATAAGVDDLWQHSGVRSLGQLARRSSVRKNEE